MVTFQAIKQITLKETYVEQDAWGEQKAVVGERSEEWQ